MSCENPIIQFESIRIRIDVLEKEFADTAEWDYTRIYMLMVELASAYQSYNVILKQLSEIQPFICQIYHSRNWTCKGVLSASI